MPQELKNLIKRCWDSDPEKRPTAKELYDIISSWKMEIYDGDTTLFSLQYQTTGAEYSHFFWTPYRTHPTAITTSKLINTKEIAQKLTEQYSNSLVMDFSQINLEENQQAEQQAQIIHNPPKSN